MCRYEYMYFSVFLVGGGVECTLLNPFQFSDQIMQILLPYAKIDN